MLHFCFREWYLSLESHTQHAITQVQCCVSAILDPLLQLWTSRWCHGAKMVVSLARLSTRLASGVGALAGC